jgi:putative transposase
MTSPTAGESSVSLDQKTPFKTAWRSKLATANSRAFRPSVCLSARSFASLLITSASDALSLGGIRRSSIRYLPQPRSDEGPLRATIIRLASQFGRYGYRQITALLWQEGWDISRSRVERIWKLEGLKVPQKQPKRGRLWLTDGSCVRLRPTHRNHVWSWDFVMDRTDDGRAIKMLTLIDEYTKESLAIYPARRIRSHDVIDIFADVMIERGVP